MDDPRDIKRFVEAARAFKRAGFELLKTWCFEFPDSDPVIVSAYPFARAFDDELKAIMDWTDAIEAAAPAAIELAVNLKLSD